MDQSYSPAGSENQAIPKQPRAILEFIEGDLNRAPIVYPTAGSAEADEALRREILKRWNRG
jgi:hypothetical protein